MTRRSGLTMTEVLVALFIMALGTIAILTLFPLGMLNMSRALQDDRTSQAAGTADGIMRVYWKTYLVEKQLDPNLIAAFDQPAGLPNISTDTTSASYPVFVDPIGCNIGTAPALVGGSAGIPRVNTILTTSKPLAQRACVMTDGISYAINGSPDVTSGPIERDMLYSWLWVLQRPRNGDHSTATMQIVVYINRSPDYLPPNAEQSFTTNMVPNLTTLALPRTSALIKGNWILDAGSTTINLRQANFYRVSSVTDNGANLIVELETPIHRNDGSGAAYTGTIVTLPQVVDVFQRPNLTP